MTPVLSDLQHSSPALTRFTRQLGPFSRSATRSLTTLGSATDVGGPVLQRARPVVQDLKSFAASANPVSRTLDDLTASLDRTGGLERAMDYIFFQMTAVNGFDSIGHYLRAGLVVNTCSNYATSPVSGCGANFTHTSATQAGSASAASAGDPVLARTEAALREATGQSTASVAAPRRAAKQTPAEKVASVLRSLLSLGQGRQLTAVGQRGLQQLRSQASGDSSPALSSVGGDGRQQALLDYLMGGDR
jgi:hypothetical protein